MIHMASLLYFLWNRFILSPIFQGTRKKYSILITFSYIPALYRTLIYKKIKLLPEDVDLFSSIVPVQEYSRKTKSTHCLLMFWFLDLPGCQKTWYGITNQVYGFESWWLISTLISRFVGPTWAHLGPTGPRWAPCWPHELCYVGRYCAVCMSINGTTTSIYLYFCQTTRRVKCQARYLGATL